MKVLFISLFFLIFSFTYSKAQSNDVSKFTILLRGLQVVPNEKDNIKEGALMLANGYAAEIDLNYFINEKLAVEFSISGSKHEARIQYSDHYLHRYVIGDILIMPVMLSFQYHFSVNKFKPYLGAGINYSIFGVMPETLEGGVNGGKFKNAFGGVLQGGVNYTVNSKWFVNFNIKKLFLSTDVITYRGLCEGVIEKVPCPNYKTEEMINKASISPLSIGIGVGYKLNW